MIQLRFTIFLLCHLFFPSKSTSFQRQPSKPSKPYISAIFDTNYSYRVIITNPSTNETTTIFQGADIAIKIGQDWCVNPVYHTRPTQYDHLPTMFMKWEKTLTHETKTSTHFSCKNIPIIISIQNFIESNQILFQVILPNGTPPKIITNDSDNDASSIHFPAFDLSSSFNFSMLSWQGSFVQSVRGQSTGSTGGPTVFYDDTLENVIVTGPAPTENTHLKSFTAGNHKDWKGVSNIWSPGTSDRIRSLPPNMTQSFLLHWGEKSGITSTLHQWGKTIQQMGTNKHQFPPDVTLKKIGYQTDNGAAYCFCREKNCSQVLIDELSSLNQSNVPMGYLSFQGAGTSSGRGQAAPWCVSTWGVDGGLDQNHYPMPIPEFQKAIGIPLQLYCPYFCPTTDYFSSRWKAVSSDSSLPSCKDFDFLNVAPEQSYDFYGWFMDKGMENAGMVSFESDFMNQNYNCVPAFVESATNADIWLQGMADAALERDLSVQWCYATPSDVLASVKMPAVTQFRVSFDYCYGRSWDIGESSLLVWALGKHPSKDTLWTTDNARLETPGCPWTPDKESEAAELHLILALMSTGPVGISDSIGYSNSTLLKRAIRTDGVLLKPSKAITAVDTAFLTSKGRVGGYLYGTAGIGPSWIFVSFQTAIRRDVTVQDFWPPLPQLRPAFLAIRQNFKGPCVHNTSAVNCVDDLVRIQYKKDKAMHTSKVFSLPPKNEDSSLFAPTLSYAWKNCKSSHWFLLGELSKYVPLSPARFQSLSCTQTGVSAIIIGDVGEEVELTALRPQQRPSTISLVDSSNYEVVIQKVTIPSSKRIRVTFGGEARVDVIQ